METSASFEARSAPSSYPTQPPVVDTFTQYDVILIRLRPICT